MYSADYYCDFFKWNSKKTREQEEERLQDMFDGFIHQMMDLASHAGQKSIILHTYLDYHKHKPNLEIFEFWATLYEQREFNSTLAAWVMSQMMCEIELKGRNYDKLIKSFLELGFYVEKIWRSRGSGENFYFIIGWDEKKKGKYYERELGEFELKEIELEG